MIDTDTAELAQQQEKAPAPAKRFRRPYPRLAYDEYWPVYKKLRRLAQKQLIQCGRAANDDVIDQFLFKSWYYIEGELKKIWRRDIENRKAALENAR